MHIPLLNYTLVNFIGMYDNDTNSNNDYILQLYWALREYYMMYFTFRHFDILLFVTHGYKRWAEREFPSGDIELVHYLISSKSTPFTQAVA